MDGKVTLEVTAETPEGKLVLKHSTVLQLVLRIKRFKRRHLKWFPNDVINLVLTEIANDPELQNYMKERF